MTDTAEARTKGRPLTRQRDATMRYIAKKNLWQAVAIQCGISEHAVRCWRQVPHQRVLAVEAAIGRSRRLIRPDLFPENQENHHG